MHSEGRKALKSIDFLPQYFAKPTALISDVRDTQLIEPRLECAPSSLSEGQIVYHPGVVKVRLFIGRSDLSPAIGMPPGPGCTDKMSCRQGDALAEGPVNKADGFHDMPFLLCVLSGAQPGALNAEQRTCRYRCPEQVFPPASVTYDLGLCARQPDHFLSPFSGTVNSFCQIQSTCLNLLITAPTHLVHSVN